MIPFLLILVGIVLVVAGFRGKAAIVGEILADDFTGRPSFIGWIVAVITVALVGSLDKSGRLAPAFYTLLLVVLLLSNRGFFPQLQSQLLE